ncbi:hypothetical protein [Verrucomicrobium spinosum]|uniref:hypothetical protein n=1 Tax=Verrucomicrobium spinosum TaxID=2736 RepID=UPI000A54DD47|nr:hypothetical protein [Verrucomicrobium spinosum]
MTKTLSWIFSHLAIATMGLLLGIFIWQSAPVWKHEGWGYVLEKKWYFRQHEFGALPMVYGTLVVSFIALVLAVPVAGEQRSSFQNTCPPPPHGGKGPDRTPRRRSWSHLWSAWHPAAARLGV